ncbi:MAG TPA: crotonase/enoyl-CoA hydratase family protein [Streptosporangiaceae bacterium]
MTSDRVTVTVRAGVADVRLNRPDKLNALDGRLIAAIVEAGEALKSDRSVRAVVLSGEGRGFCAGLDFAAFQMMAGSTPAEATGSGHDDAGTQGLMQTSGRITHLGQQAGWVWQELEVPVIAAVSGPCLGGGLQIALGADIRIVAPDARLSVLEMRWGLIPDMIGTWVLPRLVGEDVAKELTFTGRMVSGEEAVRLRLATRTAQDPFAEAMALATEIAGRSPAAIRQAKRLLNASVEPGRTPAGQFLDERQTMAALIGSPGNVEAVTAYFEKRDPAFPDA